MRHLEELRLSATQIPWVILLPRAAPLVMAEVAHTHVIMQPIIVKKSATKGANRRLDKLSEMVFRNQSKWPDQKDLYWFLYPTAC